MLLQCCKYTGTPHFAHVDYPTSTIGWACGIMEHHSTDQDDAIASSLFRGLLVPSPTVEDVQNIVVEPRFHAPRNFVVNTSAGHDLCAQLEPHTFTALSVSMQARILALMEVGLSAGVCSAVRLRLACESESEHPSLVWRLLVLLEEMSNKRVGDDAPQVLGRVLGMVCSAGIDVGELKWILREVRVSSAVINPHLLALKNMVTDSSSRGGAHFDWDESTSGRSPLTVHSMFNFDGAGSGLVLPDMDWPFAQEYQIALWLRVEHCAGLASIAGGGSVTRRAHLVTFATYGGAGVDYYFEVSLDVGQPKLDKYRVIML